MIFRTLQQKDFDKNATTTCYMPVFFFFFLKLAMSGTQKTWSLCGTKKKNNSEFKENPLAESISGDSLIGAIFRILQKQDLAAELVFYRHILMFYAVTG